MSATYDKYQRRLLRDCYEVEEEEIIEFANLKTFVTGVPTEDFDYSSEVSQDVESLKDKPLGMEIGELKTDVTWDPVRDHEAFKSIVQ